MCDENKQKNGLHTSYALYGETLNSKTTPECDLIVKQQKDHQTYCIFLSGTFMCFQNDASKTTSWYCDFFML